MIEVNKIKIKDDYLKSVLIPPIPLYKIKIDMLEYDGLSGSIVISDDKIIGMITSVTKKSTLEAIPMILIFNFVKTMITYNKYTDKQIEIFKFDIGIIEFADNDGIDCVAPLFKV